MGLAVNSYGSTNDVAALTPRYANSDKKFDETTRPTLLEVENWCNQISAIVNTMLSQAGFSIPVTQTDAKLTLDFFVNQEVASICEGINGGGRFGPSAKESNAKGKGRFALMVEDVEVFIDAHKKGFAELGVPVQSGTADNILTRGVDEQGDDVFPIRQRKEFFGENFIDWDKD